MKTGGRLKFSPHTERMEARLVMSGANSVAAEVRSILKAAPTGTPVRPNTPVLPLESAPASATFLDPSSQILRGQRIGIGQRDYLAPFVSLDARNGYIKIGSSTTIGDNTSLIASATKPNGLTGISIGDDVAIAAGVSITGPASIGFRKGVATSIGANAVIDGAIIQAGAVVGALARVGPGVTIDTGFQVLPGANVTTQAQATNPALGKVALVTPAELTTAGSTVTRGVALASAYTNLYQGISATGPGSATSGGPVPAALNGSTTIFFGSLNNVLGISPEPGARFATFEPTTGNPTFLAADGSNITVPQAMAYSYPDRIIGQVVFGQPFVGSTNSLSRRDSIRGDEGQAIVFNGPINNIGNNVTIHSPLGGVRSTTTTTVVTSTTAAGVTTSTTTATTTTSMAAATATAGTTTATTTGRNAAGVATTGTVTTTIANTNTVIGGMNIGTNFSAGNNATILGGPTALSTFGDNVTIGSGAVIDTSSLGSNVTIGDRAYIANSTIAPGTVIPAGAIFINNVYQGQIQY